MVGYVSFFKFRPYKYHKEGRREGVAPPESVELSG